MISKFSILITIIFLFGNKLSAEAQSVELPENTEHFRYVEELLSEKMVKQISEVTNSILAKCTPPDCMVIGLGRSPTPFMAHLELLNPNTTINLPLSNFRFFPNANKINQEHKRILFSEKVRALTLAQEEHLFRYFDDFLIPQIPKNIKTFTLVDFAYTGESLYSAQAYLERYILQRNLPFQMKVIAIAPSGRIYSIKKLAKSFSLKMPDIIRISSTSTLFEALKDEKFRNVSIYKSYPFLENRKIQEKLPEKNGTQLRRYFQIILKEKIENPKKSKIKTCVQKKSLLILGRFFK